MAEMPPPTSLPFDQSHYETRKATVLYSHGDNETVSIEFDAVELYAPRASVEISEYPIEQGSPAMDHVRQSPFFLRMRCFVSNSPAREGLDHMDELVPVQQYAVQVLRRGFEAADKIQLHVDDPVQVPPRVVTVSAQVRRWLPHGYRIMRVFNIYNLLLDSMYSAREFTVTNDMIGDFDHMLIKSVHTDRDDKSGTGMSLEIEMQQISYAQLLEREIGHLLPKESPASSRRPRNNRSKKPKPAATPATPYTPPPVVQGRSAADVATYPDPTFSEFPDVPL